MTLSRKKRVLLEKHFNLEEGSTDGMSIREIEEMLGEERGALDIWKCYSYNELIEFFEEAI